MVDVEVGAKALQRILNALMPGYVRELEDIE